MYYSRIEQDLNFSPRKSNKVYIFLSFHQVNKCDDPVSVTALLDVPDLQNVKWSHTYNSDDIVKVLGFITFLPSILFADVYVQVKLKSNEDRLYLEVNTSCKLKCVKSLAVAV